MPIPHVQREALRAIIQIGSAEAYASLEQALKAGEARAREAIMQTIGSFNDERAAPLLVHILEHTSHRAPASRPTSRRSKRWAAAAPTREASPR